MDAHGRTRGRHDHVPPADGRPVVVSEAHMHLEGARLTTRDMNSAGTSWQRGIAWHEEPVLVTRLDDLPDPAARPVRATAVHRVTPFSRHEALSRLPRVVRDLSRALTGARLTLIKVPGVLGMVAGELSLHRGIPLAVEVVADLRHGPNPMAPGRLGRVLRAIQLHHARRLLQHARAVRFVSTTIQENHPEVDPSVSVVGDDMLDVPAPPPADREGRTETVVCVASLQHFKGHLDLVEALRRLRARGLRPRTLLVGEGPFRQRITQAVVAADLEDQVTLLGWQDRDRTLGLIAQGGCLVLPSHTEGMPRSVLEGLSLGTPTYATAVGGVPEVLPPDQLFAPGDVQALTLLLERHLLEPGRAARVAASTRARGREIDRRRQEARRRWQRLVDDALSD